MTQAFAQFIDITFLFFLSHLPIFWIIWWLPMAILFGSRSPWHLWLCLQTHLHQGVLPAHGNTTQMVSYHSQSPHILLLPICPIHPLPMSCRSLAWLVPGCDQIHCLHWYSTVRPVPVSLHKCYLLIRPSPNSRTWHNCWGFICCGVFPCFSPGLLNLPLQHCHQNHNVTAALHKRWVKWPAVLHFWALTQVQT